MYGQTTGVTVREKGPGAQKETMYKRTLMERKELLEKRKANQGHGKDNKTAPLPAAPVT